VLSYFLLHATLPNGYLSYANGSSVIITLLVSMSLLGFSIAVLARKSFVKKTLFLLIGCLILFCLLNPRIFNFWKYVEVDIVPGEATDDKGTGIVTKQVTHVDTYFPNNNERCYQHGIFVLEDGSKFYVQEYEYDEGALKVGYRVLVEDNKYQDKVREKPYILHFKKKYTGNVIKYDPVFRLPIFEREYNPKYYPERWYAYKDGEAHKDKQPELLMCDPFKRN